MAGIEKALFGVGSGVETRLKVIAKIMGANQSEIAQGKPRQAFFNPAKIEVQQIPQRLPPFLHDKRLTISFRKTIIERQFAAHQLDQLRSFPTAADRNVRFSQDDRKLSFRHPVQRSAKVRLLQCRQEACIRQFSDRGGAVRNIGIIQSFGPKDGSLTIGEPDEK